MAHYCESCGANLGRFSRYCPECGLATAARANPDRNRMVAVALAVLLGFIGFHKFYLGRIWVGVLYAVFCWTGIPLIAGLFDAAILLSMSERDFDARYNQ